MYISTFLHISYITLYNLIPIIIIFNTNFSLKSSINTIAYRLYYIMLYVQIVQLLLTQNHVTFDINYML